MASLPSKTSRNVASDSEFVFIDSGHDWDHLKNARKEEKEKWTKKL